MFQTTNQVCLLKPINYLRPRLILASLGLRKKQGQKFSSKFYQEKVVTHHGISMEI